jgi:hypothetical protein
MDKIRTRKIIEKFNLKNSWFFEIVNKIDEPPTKLTKKEIRHKFQISRMKQAIIDSVNQ